MSNGNKEKRTKNVGPRIGVANFQGARNLRKGWKHSANGDEREKGHPRKKTQEGRLVNIRRGIQK